MKDNKKKEEKTNKGMVNLANSNNTNINSNLALSKVEKAVNQAVQIFEESGINLAEKTKEDITKKISLETFADPTRDPTFKMLFNKEENKDILISLINNLLGFKGDKEIKEVTLSTNELPVIGHFEQKEKKAFKVKSGISSAVDVLCTTKNNQKIIVEMQRENEEYFLARSQEYLAKTMTSYVKEGEGQDYHNKVLDTYMLSIGKENMFRGQYALSDQKLFEITVVPCVVETAQEVPGNKMHWKFYELIKFKTNEIFKNINKSSDLKHQWLEFFINCNKQTVEPERDNLIKKGYDIMKTAKWTDDQYIHYALSEIKERYETLERDNLIEKAFNKGKLEERLTGDINNIKTGLKLNIEPDNLIKTFIFKCLNKKHFLEKDWSVEQLGKINKKVKDDNVEVNKSTNKDVSNEFVKFLDIFGYVKDHQAEKSNTICNDLKLIEDLEGIGYNSDLESFEI